MNKSPIMKITIKEKDLDIKSIKKSIIELLKISNTIKNKMLKVPTENDEYVIADTETLNDISELLEKMLLQEKKFRSTLKLEAASFRFFFIKKQTEDIFTYPDTQTNEEIEEESKTQSIDDRLPTKRKLQYPKEEDIPKEEGTTVCEGK